MSIYQRGMIFRSMQLLTGLINELQAGSLIPVIVSLTTLISAFALSTLVKGSNSDMLFVATLFLLLADCCLVVLVILGQMAIMHSRSRTILDTMKRRTTVFLSALDRKWEQRFYRSCSYLKFMIGSVNFVDELTPLNCLQFSVTLSVNVLLLTA